jgi:parvulin-like peptidyl-prolyl isomerase
LSFGSGWRVVIGRWLREPLLHFLLIGAALFAVDAALRPAAREDHGSKQIQLREGDLSQLLLAFQAQWRRQPTPEELSRLIEDRIREEVLYREALAMGLDQDDSIVKRRMAQKMQFLAEDVAAAREPSTDELRSWYAAHRGEFALPPRVSFRHAYFSPDRRGERAQAEAAEALTRLSGQPQDSPLAASLADSFMFQDYYGDRSTEQLARDFGPRFAQAVSRLTPGSWQGPIESGYGWHLVFVDSLIPGRTPDFEEIEPDVKTAWLTDQKEQAWRKAYDEMRAKYTVLLPAPSEQQTP